MSVVCKEAPAGTQTMIESIAYSMVIFLVAETVDLGITIDRIPFFRLALTLSWSTRPGKVKVRWNSPTERSLAQKRWLGLVV